VLLCVTAIPQKTQSASQKTQRISRMFIFWVG